MESRSAPPSRQQLEEDANARCRELFTVFDRNGNGVVTKSELVQAIRKTDNAETLTMFYDELGLPNHVRQGDESRTQILAIFQEMDENEDREINLDEFGAFLRARRRKLEAKKRKGATKPSHVPTDEE